MGGGKFKLHISSLHSLCKFRCKIIKKIAHTQYVRAFFYAKYLFYVIFYEKSYNRCQFFHTNVKKRTRCNKYYELKPSHISCIDKPK